MEIKLPDLRSMNLVVKEIDCVLEKCQPVTGRRVPFAGPSRMMRRIDEPLWVWHQSKNSSGCVADSSDICGRSIGIVRINDIVVASIGKAIA